ncbi:MAG: hypothetical protein JXB14_00520, partial [Candidatus Altiarchaeota archaeon]|nr:hypothetical protein [Candidatus Altiarchaeota archaeon]
IFYSQVTGVATITATNGCNEGSTEVNVYACTGDQLDVTAFPLEIPADGVSTSTIVGQLEDAVGNPVSQAGLPVECTTDKGEFPNGMQTVLVTTNMWGTATALLTSTTEAGVATVVCHAGTLSDSVQVKFIAGTFEDKIELKQHTWKLISVPKKLDPAGFNDLFEADDVLLNYTAAAGIWQLISAVMPADIKPLYGYWAYSINDETILLAYDQGQIVPPQLDLTAGWNLIGHGSRTSMPVEDALFSIDSKYAFVLRYTGGSWEIYSASGFPQQFTNMNPVEGYWIFMTQDGTYAAPGI